MNRPPYILVDEMATVVAATKAALNLPNLNYLYGPLDDIVETLEQDSKTEAFRSKKYPLVWLFQPFTVKRGTLDIYGIVNDVRILIINGTDKNWKPAQRMANNFKPVLYPISGELLNQINTHKAFLSVGTENLKVNETDRYYWDEQEKLKIPDVFDCRDLSGMEIKLKNNRNCP